MVTREAVITRPIRVLHVAGGMDCTGGVQTGLMNLLRNATGGEFEMHFLVDEDRSYDYEEEIARLGGKMLACTNPRNPCLYARNFAEVVRSYGPYDIVHAHVGFRGGFICKLAHREKVPVRIVHSHDAFDNVNSTIRRRLYVALQKRWIDRYATHGIGVSEKATEVMFGPRWQSDPRWRTMPWCVIDVNAPNGISDRATTLSEFAIRPDAIVIGHVGRMERQKNPLFILEVAECVCSRSDRTFFLLVGTGSMLQSMKADLARRNLEDRVLLAGARRDVHRLMTSAFDLLILPSLHEGLPVVLVEAQAAGLPCLISDVITREVDLVPQLIHRLSLQCPAERWAERILEIVSDGPKIGRPEAFAVVSNSRYNATNSAHALTNLYRNAVSHTDRRRQTPR